MTRRPTLFALSGAGCVVLGAVALLLPDFSSQGWSVVRQVLSVLLIVAATFLLQLSILRSAWETSKKRRMSVANLVAGALMVAELAWLFLSSSIDYLPAIVFAPMVLLNVCWVVIAVTLVARDARKRHARPKA